MKIVNTLITSILFIILIVLFVLLCKEIEPIKARLMAIEHSSFKKYIELTDPETEKTQLFILAAMYPIESVDGVEITFPVYMSAGDVQKQIAEEYMEKLEDE